jgi:hypothetical protein
LVNLVLFEPVGDVSRGEIRTGPRVIHLIQLFDGIDEEVALFLADSGEIAADSISEHGGYAPCCKVGEGGGGFVTWRTGRVYERERRHPDGNTGIHYGSDGSVEK